ncbi:MAG TPA: DinB family protein [Saprospiraceae bacterium]|nr:DinB family protein [Saprospiraceae bacterium]
MNWKRPTPEEYHPFYKNYVQKVPEGDFLRVFEAESKDTEALLASLSGAQWNYSYAPGKWTLKELIVHMLDSERVFCYRALRIARGDTTRLPGFEQDDYIPTSEANDRSGDRILEEWKALRASTLVFLSNLTPAMIERQGTASGATVSVRALGYMTLGHELHHRAIIKDRYL